MGQKTEKITTNEQLLRLALLHNNNKRVLYHISSRIEILTTVLLVGVVSTVIITITSPIVWYTCEICTDKLIFTATKRWNERMVVSPVISGFCEIYSTLITEIQHGLNLVESFKTTKLFVKTYCLSLYA